MQEEVTVNYELIAFEWVDSHILELNNRLNQAIGEGKDNIILSPSELPVRECWDKLCDELTRAEVNNAECTDDGTSSNSNTQVTAEEYTAIEATPPRELTPEEKIEAAMSVMCPVSRYAGKTLGEVSNIDPNAIVWVATKYKGDESVKQAAILLCEHAKEQMAS